MVIMVACIGIIYRNEPWPQQHAIWLNYIEWFIRGQPWWTLVISLLYSHEIFLYLQLKFFSTTPNLW